MPTDGSPTAAMLRGAGLRATTPRVAVYDVLHAARGAGRHLTAAEVAAAARERVGGISTQAVYDCLDALTRGGMLRRLEPAGRPTLFEARVGDNHHHLVCRGCGATVDVECTHGSAPCLAPSDDHGFVVDEAEVIFWGRCAACAAADRAASDRAAPDRAAGGPGAGGPGPGAAAGVRGPLGAAPRPAVPVGRAAGRPR